MALGADIPELQHRISCKLPLNREVVLGCVLRPQVGLKLAVEKNRSKQRVIDRLSFCRRQDAIKRIRSDRASGLVNGRRIKEGIEQRRTAAERRFGPELRQDEFFNRVVEQTPTAPHSRGSILAKDFSQQTVVEIRAVGNAQTRSKGFVIS